MSPSPASVNIPVRFEAFATPGVGAAEITSYSWQFDDGASASGKVVSRTYTAEKTYNVTLTVTDNRGASFLTNQALIVGKEAPPSAKFSLSPADVVVGQVVFANASESKAAVGHQIVSYRWDWGDGSSSGDVIGAHAYDAAGKYTILLTVTDDAGQTGTFPQPVTVGSGNPIVVMTLTNLPSPPRTVRGNASASTAAGGANIATYIFDWSDGSFPDFVTLPIMNHTYGASGSYIVVLTVIDSVGRQTTVAQPITVP